MSCSPSSVSRGNTVICTCSGTDSGSGINDSATSAATTPSTSSTGTFTATGCSVTDYAGNSDTATDTYTVTSSGSFGTAPSYEWAIQKRHTWSKMTPGVVAIMKDFDVEMGLKQISIEVSNQAQNVVVAVRKYNGKPANVSVEKSGKTYNYLEINAENLENELNKAIVRIQVEKSWMVSNGFEAEDISMFKFNENAKKWNDLQAVYVDSEDDFYYYDVELTSFSYFAISEKAIVEEKEGGVLREKGLEWWGILLIVLGGLIIVYIIYNNKKKITNFF